MEDSPEPPSLYSGPSLRSLARSPSSQTAEIAADRRDSRFISFGSNVLENDEEKNAEFYLLKRSDYWQKWATRRFILKGPTISRGPQLFYWRPNETEDYDKTKPSGVFDLSSARVISNASESLLWIIVDCTKLGQTERYQLHLKALDRTSLCRVLRLLHESFCVLDAFLVSLAGIGDLNEHLDDSGDEKRAALQRKESTRLWRNRFRSRYSSAVSIGDIDQISMGSDSGRGLFRASTSSLQGVSDTLNVGKWDQRVQADIIRYIFEMPQSSRLYSLQNVQRGQSFTSESDLEVESQVLVNEKERKESRLNELKRLSISKSRKPSPSNDSIDMSAEDHRNKTTALLSQLQGLVDSGMLTQENFEAVEKIQVAEMAEFKDKKRAERKLQKKAIEEEAHKRARRLSALGKKDKWPEWKHMPERLRRRTLNAERVYNKSVENGEIESHDQTGYLLMLNSDGQWQTQQVSLSGIILSVSNVQSPESRKNSMGWNTNLNSTSSWRSARSSVDSGERRKMKRKLSLRRVFSGRGTSNIEKTDYVVAGCAMRVIEPTSCRFAIMCRKRGDVMPTVLHLQALDIHDWSIWISRLLERNADADPKLEDFVNQMNRLQKSDNALRDALAELRSWQEGRASCGWVPVEDVLKSDEILSYGAR